MRCLARLSLESFSHPTPACPSSSCAKFLRPSYSTFSYSFFSYSRPIDATRKRERKSLPVPPCFRERRAKAKAIFQKKKNNKEKRSEEQNYDLPRTRANEPCVAVNRRRRRRGRRDKRSREKDSRKEKSRGRESTTFLSSFRILLVFNDRPMG